ncbi:site-specific integrase [Ralstonia sp. GX3-BWBA]|uniref:site-specific integrase n=1 Tax=Ralstonia sp. GX3-BWBA TaxID=2219865 RepID=UPI000DD4556B|nr:site-specific integrase [Ralstonia sp. GX3-BWBA]
MSDIKSGTSEQIPHQAGTPPSTEQERYHVKQFILQRGANHGERISILIDRNTGVPVTLPNEHMLCGKRLMLSPNSYFNNLSGIAIIYRWAEKNGKLVSERLFGGTGFADHEVASIFTTARRRQRRSRKGATIVGKSELRARMTAIKDFVIDGMRSAAFKLDPRTDADKLNALEYRIETTRALFEQNTPKKESGSMRKGLTPKDVQLLVETIAPESEKNPWKEPLVRHRNAILVLLFLVTGGRRGDLGKLKVSDIVGGPAPYVRFCAHVNDPKDRRVAEPRLKTLPRDYPVHPAIAAAVTRYVEGHRAAIPNADRSEYLFLETGEGRELALRTINAIFETLQRVIPELTPHVLRHTETEEVLQNAEALGLTDAQILSTVMWLNGWRTDNVRTYTARKREQTARTVATARQEEFFTK